MKTTTINFTTPKGAAVTVNVIREQGYYREEVNADGDKFEISKYHDTYTILVSVASINLKDAQASIYHHPGANADGLLVNDSRRVFIAAPADVLKAIKEATTEVLDAEAKATEIRNAAIDEEWARNRAAMERMMAYGE